MEQARVWGANDLMVVAAFRYCLGRTTYIVKDCADWLIDYWPNFEQGAKDIIKKELEEAFARDDESRKYGAGFNTLSHPLGHDCDREKWARVRRLWEEK
jgi:hypothetical protein